MSKLPQLLEKAIAFDGGDARRIQHFLKVYAFADLIGRLENLPAKTQEILVTAAVLHDIGIHRAEEKYGSTSGHYQELEGPAPAREILTDLNYDTQVIDRVCYLIAHHHTYHSIDGPDYQILIEADFLVNAYEDQLKPDAICTFRDTIFRTSSGIYLLNTMFSL
ncbi:HD domain-containing protein [uncultured Megasphaera sp.]|uniref:HD domain-containing protein n=1 Tax=uncultured Megasphaera sp. TaxID=165188 RepID=UPI00265AA776|nr:HD domain-containing protein [uncultured Megasphaera sp.]